MIVGGSEDMFVILHRTDVIGDLYCILVRALVTAFTGKLIGALDPSPVLKGIVVFEHPSSAYLCG